MDRVLLEVDCQVGGLECRRDESQAGRCAEIHVLEKNKMGLSRQGREFVLQESVISQTPSGVPVLSL